MKIFEHEDFEVILRRIMCLMFCFEAIYLCSAMADSVNEITYFLHRYSFIRLLLTQSAVIIIISAAYALIPMFARLIYRLIEQIHIIVGSVILISSIAVVIAGLGEVSGLVTAVLWCFLIAGRGILYFVLITIHDKHEQHQYYDKKQTRQG